MCQEERRHSSEVSPVNSLYIDVIVESVHSPLGREEVKKKVCCVTHMLCSRVAVCEHPTCTGAREFADSRVKEISRPRLYKLCAPEILSLLPYHSLDKKSSPCLD